MPRAQLFCLCFVTDLEIPQNGEFHGQGGLVEIPSSQAQADLSTHTLSIHTYDPTACAYIYLLHDECSRHHHTLQHELCVYWTPCAGQELPARSTASFHTVLRANIWLCCGSMTSRGHSFGSFSESREVVVATALTETTHHAE